MWSVGALSVAKANDGKNSTQTSVNNSTLLEMNQKIMTLTDEKSKLQEERDTLIDDKTKLEEENKTLKEEKATLETEKQTLSNQVEKSKQTTIATSNSSSTSSSSTSNKANNSTQIAKDTSTSGNNTNASATTSSEIVYVTKTGKKYHNSGCSYLASSKIEMNLDDAQSAGYTACSKCH